MNKYIKQLVESFFDDIEDDIIDSDNAIVNHNIKTSIYALFKDIEDLFKKEFNISHITYNDANHTCYLYTNSIYEIIIDTNENALVFDNFCMFLPKLGYKTIYFEDINRLTFNFSADTLIDMHDIIIDVNQLLLTNIIPKSCTFSATTMIFYNCDFTNSDTCIFNSRKCTIKNCKNISNFEFIENCKEIVYSALIQDNLPLNKNFKTLPKTLNDITFFIGSTNNNENAFEPGNTFDGIQSVTHVNVDFSAPNIISLKNMLSSISMEAFGLVLHPYISFYLLDENAKIVINNYTYGRIYKRTYCKLVPAILQRCIENKEYFLDKFIKPAND